MAAVRHPLPNGPPDTVAGWRAAADAMLSPPCCTFHRNMEISSRYAWLHAQQPVCFKWAAMAAIASHHTRLVLYPFRLDADRSGYVDLPRSLSRWRLLTEDANRMREVNNAIYDDIFWVHLAYLAAADGVEDLRRMLRPHRQYAALLSAFETIDRGRTVLADQGSPQEARRAAHDMVWAGNLALLEHEQRVVQPLSTVCRAGPTGRERLSLSPGSWRRRRALPGGDGVSRRNMWEGRKITINSRVTSSTRRLTST